LTLIVDDLIIAGFLLLERRDRDGRRVDSVFFLFKSRLLFAIPGFCCLVALTGCSPAVGSQVVVFPNPLSIIATIAGFWAYLALPPKHPARIPALVIALVGIISGLSSIVFSVVNGPNMLGPSD
jgi:hypothetical protein